jgi:hypothetical protein
MNIKKIIGKTLLVLFTLFMAFRILFIAGCPWWTGFAILGGIVFLVGFIALLIWLLD